MKYVKIVRKGSFQTLEDEINSVLLENKNSSLIDIKYSIVTKENAVIYTAMIIFEGK